MRRLLIVTVLAATLGIFSNPQPADAQASKLLKCTWKSIESCDEDFPPSNEYMVAIRGWCYMIRIGLCMILE